MTKRLVATGNQNGLTAVDPELADNEARRVAAHQGRIDEERSYRQWYNSPAGKRRYIRKAYANGQRTFSPDKFNKATETTPDLEEKKRQALENIRAMFSKGDNNSE
jgi:hypothetical protein